MPSATQLWALSSSGTGVLHLIDLCDGAPCTDEDGLWWRARCHASTEPASADTVQATALLCSICADVDRAA